MVVDGGIRCGSLFMRVFSRALPGKKPWNMLNFCLILEAFRQFLLIGGYDASVAVFFAHSEGKSQGEAEIVSHRLMLRSGMIRQQSAGIYSWLPIGLKVLNKVCTIIREEQNRAGANEILMPTIQSADLWRESGRYDAYGKEMLRIQDRQKREMLFGPTNEEMVTDIFRSYVRSTRICRSISIISSGSSAMRCVRVLVSCAHANF